jgi:hypothetical protein
MVITLVVESPHSGNHVGGLMLDVFRRPERGVVVDNLRVRVEDRVVVAYDRPGARK